MKKFQARNVAIWLFAGFCALPLTGRSQTYQMTIPITGYLQMSAGDYNNLDAEGGFLFNLTSLQDTIYFDPVAMTIEQVGVITGTPSAPGLSFTDTQGWVGANGATGNVTVDLAPTNGVLTFDTGPQVLTYNGSLKDYTLLGQWGGLTNDFTGSYSMLTGGQTYTGSFSYNLAAADEYTGGYYVVSVAGNTLTLCPGGDYGGRFYPNSDTVANVTAADGLDLGLSIGPVGD